MWQNMNSMILFFHKLNGETIYKNMWYFCREKHKKATEYVQRAKRILELQYGIWNTGLQDIIRKEQQLEQMAV